MGYSTYQLEQLAKMTHKDLIDKSSKKKTGMSQTEHPIRRQRSETWRRSHGVENFTPGWEK